ncbi:Yqey-like protein-domain-containing protein [Mycena alexandri]|uniref:Altered inheritance of mitochondria protein 41 n=1 Tax=Mycena alexandri TaxID=1745969 RepID=A0AAD6T3T1_9AGAR|nr:Yqey-like protein-domain-containing protein [Mycena alexandri]
MAASLRWLRRPALQLCRSYGVSAESAPALDVRTQLATAVKQGNEGNDPRYIVCSATNVNFVKARDTQRSTTLRSVLAEVYTADKASNEQVNSSAIITILKKAADRRTDAAAQYTAAARPELAEKEVVEANILAEFLPPPLSEAEVDTVLRKILFEDGETHLGKVFKSFYAVMDKSRVDSETVYKRINVLLSEEAK